MINESKLNNRMLHLMESGFFGKQLLNENFSENIKVRIFQTFYNYYEDTTNWILVDGIPGKNTANAINTLMKKDKRKKYFTDGFTEESLTSYYNMVLDGIKSDYLSDLKGEGLNNIHNVRVLQAILCLSEATNVKPDGVMGPITKAAMRDKLGTDNAAQISDDKLKEIIDFAIKIVDATNMSFKIEGVEIGTDSSKTADATPKEPDAKTKDNITIFFDDIIKLAKKVKPFYIQSGFFNIDKDGILTILDKGGKNIMGFTGKITPLFIEKANAQGFNSKGSWSYDSDEDKLVFTSSGIFNDYLKAYGDITNKLTSSFNPLAKFAKYVISTNPKKAYIVTNASSNPKGK